MHLNVAPLSHLRVQVRLQFVSEAHYVLRKPPFVLGVTCFSGLRCFTVTTGDASVPARDAPDCTCAAAWRLWGRVCPLEPVPGSVWTPRQRPPPSPAHSGAAALPPWVLAGFAASLTEPLASAAFGGLVCAWCRVLGRLSSRGSLRVLAGPVATSPSDAQAPAAEVPEAVSLATCGAAPCRPPPSRWALPSQHPVFPGVAKTPICEDVKPRPRRRNPNGCRGRKSKEHGWRPLLGWQYLESGVLETWRMAVLSEAKFSRCFGKSERYSVCPASRPSPCARPWTSGRAGRAAAASCAPGPPFIPGRNEGLPFPVFPSFLDHAGAPPRRSQISQRVPPGVSCQRPRAGRGAGDGSPSRSTWQQRAHVRLSHK